MKNLVFYFWHLHKHKLTAHTDTDTDTDTDKQNYIIFLKTITEMQTNVIWDEKNPVCYTFCLLDNQNQSFKWMSVHFDWPIWIDAGSWLHWQPIHSAINDVNTMHIAHLYIMYTSVISIWLKICAIAESQRYRSTIRWSSQWCEMSN